MSRQDQAQHTRLLAIAMGVGVAGLGFLVIDLSAYLVEESNRNIAQEDMRVSAC